MFRSFGLGVLGMYSAVVNPKPSTVNKGFKRFSGLGFRVCRPTLRDLNLSPWIQSSSVSGVGLGHPKP